MSGDDDQRGEPLDPLIHVPARLRILVTLAALSAGDTLEFTRLQEMLGLTAGNLITHLRKLEDAGYISMEKIGIGVWSRTMVALTGRGRAALGAYTEALRNLLGGVVSEARERVTVDRRRRPAKQAD